MKEIQPHPEEQRSYAELREEFRAEHTADLRSQMSAHPLGWGVIGDPSQSRVHFTAEEWAREMDRRLCDTEVGFDIPEELGAVIEDQGQKALLHESVTWSDDVEGVVDHDAPACEAIQEMTELQICEYVDRAIEESRRG